MKTIKLGNEVVVSDPCYDLPTWCQAVVKNVLPGNYRTLVVKNDEGDWGIRCSRLIAIHEDYAHQDEKFRWSRYPASIGVDSGQAGIFSIETYRKDELAEQMGQGDGEGFGSGWATEEGDKWYERICTRTLGKEQWGTYSEVHNWANGYDLMVERDSGNEVRILTGREDLSKEFWEHLRDLANNVLEEMEFITAQSEIVTP